MPSQKQLYNLDSIIQKNDLTISYCSVDPKTNKDIFIKGINRGAGSFTDIFKKEFLTRSYKLSQKIRSNLILTPLKLINTTKEFLIIYPYLDSKIWQPLSKDIFRTNKKNFIKQICLIIDHLHECNLVHCDIKLSNFMYNRNTQKIILIDLDFISENQSKCNAIIKGTSEYITPDIIKNDIIDKTTDYYALGITLEKIYMNDQAPVEIKSFIKELKKDVFHKSIGSLLELLDKHRFINSQEIENYKQTLLALHLLQLRHNLSHYHRQSKKLHFLKTIFSVKNKILGFDDELLDLFITLSRKSKKIAFTHLRSLILHGRIEKLGAYWICYLSEIEIISITSQVYEHYSTDSVISEIKRLQKESKFYTVYLFIKFILQSKQHLKLTKDIFLKRSLAESCDAINKTKEAINAYLEILQIEPVEENTNTLFELCSLYLKLNNNKKATEIIEQNIQHAHISFQLRFEALQNIIAIRAGNFTKAEDFLNYIIEKSKKNNIPVSEVTSYYYLSLIYHYQGNNEKAIYYSEKSIEKATQYKLKDQLFSVQTMIIFYYTEVGLYKKAISVGNKILKDIDTFASFNKKSSILGHLLFCYLRTGDYVKAKESLFLSMTLKGNEIIESTLILFFLNFALLQLHEGDLNIAKINYRIVLKYESKELKKNIGSAYQGLQKIALYQNNQQDYKLYLDKVNYYNTYFNDISSQKQIIFISLLNEKYNKNNDIEPEQFLKLYNYFKKINEVYYANLSLLFYLLGCVACQKIPDKISTLLTDLNDVVDPIAKCTSILLSMKEIKYDNINIVINSLKNIYKELHKSKYLFFSAIISTIIGKLYLMHHNYKLSIKFYEQAKLIFYNLENDTNACRINNIIDSLKLDIQKDNLIKNSVTIKEISNILKDFDNYEVSIKKILQLILDQTGAERAVLLLTNDNCTELRVKSYVNCDEECLSDIHKFSSSITLQSFMQQNAFIIQNALTDSRSNQFKSIITHNIQSIISLPIKKEDQIQGVLYLDHQTIPALFTQEDVDFAYLLSNLLSIILNNLDKYRNISIINQELVSELESKTSYKKFISNNKQINMIFEKLPTIAKTNATILLLGESGTGKEVFADMIHELSLRAKKPFIKVNCTAIPDNLIESEFFGIDKNIATDVKGRDGKFVRADTGTIFIDEIGDMPLNIQSKILRAIEYQEFEKIGSNRTIKTDIRFIYATNKDLLQLVKEGKFREDLYHRINTIPINIPALRDRKDDIPLLIEHFTKLFTTDNLPPLFSSEILSFFEHYDWPGNVRELKNIIERLCIMYKGETVTINHLPNDIINSISQSNIKLIKELTEKDRIVEALRLHKNIDLRAAKSIGMPLSTFRRKIKKFNIKKTL